MIPVTTYRDRPVAVFGLARSGIAAARALAEGGADVTAWDDSGERREQAAAEGINLLHPGELDWARQAALVLSPGVPLTHPEPHWVVKLAHATQCPIIGDIELFAEMRPSLPINTVVAISGTNGKSTSTALLAHIIDACGGQAVACGNIGEAILDLEPLPADGIYVIEMSSYQIDLTHSLHPEIAVLLNITPDHLDRHGGMSGYVGVKRKMFEWQRPTDIAVVGIDDDYGPATVTQLEADGHTVVPISTAGRQNRGVFVEAGRIWDLDASPSAPICDLRSAASLPGEHNWQNAACAYAAARALGYAPNSIAVGLLSFPGLAHRIEYVGSFADVDYYNDSKATNADAAARALACFSRIHWILGGRAKDGGIEALQPWFSRIDRAYVIGESADEFAASLTANGVPVEMSATMDNAVNAAAAAAKPGSTVLLSPACASFDQYSDFEARGDHFKALVASLKQEACA